MTAFMRTLQAVHGTAPDPPCGEFDVEAVAEDGTRRRVPLASATRNPVRGRDPGPPDQGSGGATEPAGPMVVGVRWRSYRFCLMFQLSWLGWPWRIDPALVCPGALDAAAWGSATRRLT